MTEQQPARVSVPVSLLAALGCALVVALMSVTYLMGRIEGRGDVPAVSVVPPASAPVVVGSPPAPAEPPAVAATSPEPAVVPATSPVPESAAPPGASPEARAVATYFQQVDAAVAAGTSLTDVNGVAQVLAQDAMQGRTDGIDRLVASNELVLQRLQAVAPPTPCASLHSQTVTVTRRSLAMLREFRDAIAARELARLVGMEAAAGELSAAVERVNRESNALRERYGLPT